MTSIDKLSACVFLTCCALLGCANAEEPPRTEEGTPGSLAQVGQGASVRAVQLVRAGDDQTQHAARVHRFGKLLFGGAVAPEVVERAIRGGGARADAAQSDPEASQLRVTRLARNDDTLVVNGAVADSHGECEDVGEQAARDVFERTVAALQAEGAPEAQGLDLERVRVARLRQGAGRFGDAASMATRVQQYIFSAPRAAEQVPILDSSLSVGVHRGGALASIRSAGALSSERADARRGAVRSRRASSDHLRERMSREFPGATSHALGLRYVASLRGVSPADGVAPHEVYLVFPELHGAAGRGRGLRVAYSVTDPQAPAIYLDRVSVDDKGDTRL